MSFVWDVDSLASVPGRYETDLFAEHGVEALFYDGLPWRGKPTKVYAYMGVPKVAAGERVPGMVLIHGGGGTAFADWVRLWNSRGYAAIAMDVCGCLGTLEDGCRPRHDDGGPAGWTASFEQLDWSVEDQWPYHAVADVMLANSLLRSLDAVDENRIGVTGISWGGYLTSIVSAVDNRFRFACPVYGCGYLGGSPVWVEFFEKMGAESSGRWLEMWDPSVFLPETTMPTLWVTGTNDAAYPMDSFQRSYRRVAGARTLSIRVDMGHGQAPGCAPEEIRVYADGVMGHGVPLIDVGSLSVEDGMVSVPFFGQANVEHAQLCYTTDHGAWQGRQWRVTAGMVDVARGSVMAKIPEDVTACYFNVIDSRGMVVSSEHVAF